jgi:hypothetical protein
MNTYECFGSRDWDDISFGNVVSEEFLKECLSEGTRGIVRLWWAFRNQHVRIVGEDGYGYAFNPHTRLWDYQGDFFQREIRPMISAIRQQQFLYLHEQHEGKSPSERRSDKNLQKLLVELRKRVKCVQDLNKMEEYFLSQPENIFPNFPSQLNRKQNTVPLGGVVLDYTSGECITRERTREDLFSKYRRIGDPSIFLEKSADSSVFSKRLLFIL